MTTVPIPSPFSLRDRREQYSATQKRNSKIRKTIVSQTVVPQTHSIIIIIIIKSVIFLNHLIYVVRVFSRYFVYKVFFPTAATLFLFCLFSV